MEHDAKGISSKVADLRSKVSSTNAAVRNLRDELEKTGNTKVKTKAVEGFEKDIAKAQAKLNELDWQAEQIIAKKRVTFGIDKDDDSTLSYFLEQDREWTKLQEKIAKTEGELTRYKVSLSKAQEAAPLAKDTAAYKQQEQRLADLTGQLDVYKLKLREAEEAQAQEAAQTESSSRQEHNYRQRLDQTVKALKMLVSGLGKAYNSLKRTFSATAGRAVQRFGSHFKGANKQTNILEKSLRRIKNTLVRMFFYRLVHSPIDAIKEGLGEIAKINPTVNRQLSELKTSSTYLKNSFAALAAPLVNLLTPAMTRFLNVTAAVTDNAARLISMLSGQNSYTRAVRVQQDYAASLDDSTESLEKNSKAAQENQKFLAGYDELNVMSDNDSGKSSQSAFENAEAQVDGLSESLLNALKAQDWDAVGSLIGDKVNTALSKFNWSKIKKTAKQWASNVAGLFNGFLRTADWDKVGKTAAEGVNTVIGFVLGFSYTFDWRLFGRSLRESLTGFFKNLDKDDIVAAFDSVVNGLISAGIELIGDPAEWTEWGTSLESSIKRAIEGISWENVKTFFQNLLRGVFNFGDGFFGSLFEDADKALEGKDFNEFGHNAAKSFKEIDWEKVFGEESTIGKFIKVIGDTVTAGLDFIVGFLEEPGTADKIAGGFEVLMDSVPWEEIIIKALSVALFDLPAWITDFATKLITDFCEGLATGFQYSQNDEKLNKAALGLAKSLGNLIISVVESVVNIIINAVPNLVLGALKLIWDLVSGFVSLFLGQDFYQSATQNLWGSDSFRFDWKVEIPRLATGTVVPAHYGEFLAVLGDNKREPEVVSPVSAMKQAFLEALAEGGYGGSDRPVYCNVVLEDGTVLFRAMGEADDSFYRSHGFSRFDRRRTT